VLSILLVSAGIPLGEQVDHVQLIWWAIATSA
jgi:hypothetical protein